MFTTDIHRAGHTTAMWAGVLIGVEALIIVLLIGALIYAQPMAQSNVRDQAAQIAVLQATVSAIPTPVITPPCFVYTYQMCR